MRRALSLVVPLALLAALALLCWPQLRLAWRTVNLLREAPPSVGSLPDPLPGRRFADTWGGARSEGRRHQGVDIFAPRGTPIHATTRGVVVQRGQDRLGGNVVTVMGPGGYRHYYAHLSAFKVRAGQWVEEGAVLGLVGNSGNARATPPHLHYGVYTPAWQAVNPYPLLIGK